MDIQHTIETIKQDKRFEVTLEWCGAPVKHYVIRFCNDWVCSDVNVERAWEKAARWNLKRIL